MPPRGSSKKIAKDEDEDYAPDKSTRYTNQGVIELSLSNNNGKKKHKDQDEGRNDTGYEDAQQVKTTKVTKKQTEHSLSTSAKKRSSAAETIEPSNEESTSVDQDPHLAKKRKVSPPAKKNAPTTRTKATEDVDSKMRVRNTRSQNQNAVDSPAKKNIAATRSKANNARNAVKEPKVIDLSDEEPFVIEEKPRIASKRLIKPTQGFPRFDDGDVYIELKLESSEYSYLLHSRILSLNSPWFKEALSEPWDPFDTERALAFSKRTGIVARFELFRHPESDVEVVQRTSIFKSGDLEDVRDIFPQTEKAKIGTPMQAVIPAKHLRVSELLIQQNSKRAPNGKSVATHSGFNVDGAFEASSSQSKIASETDDSTAALQQQLASSELSQDGWPNKSVSFSTQVKIEPHENATCINSLEQPTAFSANQDTGLAMAISGSAHASRTSNYQINSPTILQAMTNTQNQDVGSDALHFSATPKSNSAQIKSKVEKLVAKATSIPIIPQARTKVEDSKPEGMKSGQVSIDFKIEPKDNRNMAHGMDAQPSAELQAGNHEYSMKNTEHMRTNVKVEHRDCEPELLSTGGVENRKAIAEAVEDTPMTGVAEEDEGEVALTEVTVQVDPWYGAVNSKTVELAAETTSVNINIDTEQGKANAPQVKTATAVSGIRHESEGMVLKERTLEGFNTETIESEKITMKKEDPYSDEAHNTKAESDALTGIKHDILSSETNSLGEKVNNNNIATSQVWINFEMKNDESGTQQHADLPKEEYTPRQKEYLALEKEGIVQIADPRPEILDAYNNLFLIYYGKVPVFNYANFDLALEQIELLVKIAGVCGSIAVVKPYLESALFRFQREVPNAIKEDPPRWLMLSLKLKSEVIYREAVIHLVARYPFWPSCSKVTPQDLPTHVCAMMEICWNETALMKSEVDRKLVCNSVAAVGEGDIDIKDKAQIHTWFVVQFWRNWLTEALKHASALEEDHRENECGALYRLIAQGGDAYLPLDKVAAKLSAFLGREKFREVDVKQVDRDLTTLKKQAQNIVAPLCVNNSMISVSDSGIKYLTCYQIKNEDIPWIALPEEYDF